MPASTDEAKQSNLICLLLMKGRLERGWVRAFAAVTLLAWVAAQILCTAHCSFGICSGEGQASCHKSALQSHHHEPPEVEAHHHANHSGEPPASSDMPSSVCLALKSALVNSASLKVTYFQSQAFFTVWPVLLATDVKTFEQSAQILRQVKRAIWVFTPEVCLGPAFRGLAPPVLL